MIATIYVEHIVTNIVPFKKPSKRKVAEGKTLCKNGFHAWKIDKAKQFDTKQGRLVTVYKCKRCGATKSKAI